MASLLTLSSTRGTHTWMGLSVLRPSAIGQVTPKKRLEGVSNHNTQQIWEVFLVPELTGLDIHAKVCQILALVVTSGDI